MGYAREAQQTRIVGMGALAAGGEPQNEAFQIEGQYLQRPRDKDELDI